MSGEAGRAPPEITPPKSTSELIAMALAMEREAAARYDELATEMARHGNHELADLFEGLGAEERKHEAHIGRWLGPGISEPPAIAFEWRSPESIDQDEENAAGSVYLMTPYRALRLAVHNEERAFDFFSWIAATAADPDIRAHAETIAKEELDHVVRLRLERRRAHRAETQSAVRSAPRQGPRTVRTLAALRARAQAIEAEAALSYDTLGHAMSARADSESAELFRDLAATQRAVLLSINQPSEAPVTDIGEMTQAVGQTPTITSYNALRRALNDAEMAFDFYAAIAEQSPEQGLMEESQTLAEHALHRLKRIGVRLNAVPPPSEGAGAG